MPIGGQLIGDLLQGAFSSDNINNSPAAGGYAYTPDQQLDDFNAHHGTGYKSIQEAQDDDNAPDAVDNLTNKTLYYDKKGNLLPDGVVKSSDDLLPYKKPGFFQRAFSPTTAEGAIQGNRQFNMEPIGANLANRTKLQIGGDNTALAAGNLYKPLSTQDPRATYLLSNENPAASNLADINVSNPIQGALTKNTQLQAQQQIAGNEKTKAQADTLVGNPLRASNVEAARLENEGQYLNAVNSDEEPKIRAQADTTGSMAREVQNREALKTIPVQNEAERARYENLLAAAPLDKRIDLAQKAKSAGMSEAELKLLDLDKDTLQKISEYANWKATYPAIVPYRTSLMGNQSDKGKYKLYPDYKYPGARLTAKDLSGNFLQDINGDSYSGSPVGSPLGKPTKQVSKIVTIKDGTQVPIYDDINPR